MNKGLEALKILGDTEIRLSLGCMTTIKSFHTKPISIIEKELKALEIISQLFDFKYFIEEWYKRGVLPQEEYDLLKEVLL